MTAIPSDVPAISIERLTKHFGEVRAVNDLSFEVRRGEVFGFLGLNGAGKTTTIRLLLDLLRPTSGSAHILGFDSRTDSIRTRGLLGYLPGELGIYGDMTGVQVLGLLASLSATAVDSSYRARILDLMELTRSDLRRPLREYSTGMKRKLGLVQALQADPEILILDEPSEGLDPLMQRNLHALLFELRERGRTVFMSSHVLSEVERICDRIALIRKGELVLLSTVEEARRLGGRTIRVTFDRAVDPPSLPSGVTVLDRTETSWSLRIQSEAGELVRLIGGLPVRDLEIVEPALEDVLERFYREES